MIFVASVSLYGVGAVTDVTAKNVESLGRCVRMTRARGETIGGSENSCNLWRIGQIAG